MLPAPGECPKSRGTVPVELESAAAFGEHEAPLPAEQLGGLHISAIVCSLYHLGFILQPVW